MIRSCGKATKNPFFNFLRCYRSKSENQHRSAAINAVLGAREWNKMTEEQRQPFVDMAKPYLKRKTERKTRSRVRAVKRRTSKSRQRRRNRKSPIRRRTGRSTVRRASRKQTVGRKTSKRRSRRSGSRKTVRRSMLRRVRRSKSPKPKRTYRKLTAPENETDTHSAPCYRKNKPKNDEFPIAHCGTSPAANSCKYVMPATNSCQHVKTENLTERDKEMKIGQHKRRVKGCSSCHIPTPPRVTSCSVPSPQAVCRIPTPPRSSSCRVQSSPPLKGLTTPPKQSPESPNINRWESRSSESQKSSSEKAALSEARKKYCQLRKKNSEKHPTLHKGCSFIDMNCEICPCCSQSFFTESDSSDSEGGRKCGEKFRQC